MLVLLPQLRPVLEMQFFYRIQVHVLCNSSLEQRGEMNLNPKLVTGTESTACNSKPRVGRPSPHKAVRQCCWVGLHKSFKGETWPYKSFKVSRETSHFSTHFLLLEGTKEEKPARFTPGLSGLTVS